MKKNEKGFMQDEKNLEKVSGGAMASGIDVDQKISFDKVKADAKFELINSKNINNRQNIKGNDNETNNMSANTIY